MDIQTEGRVMQKALAQVLVLMFLWLGTAAHAGTVTYVYTDPQGTPLAEADAAGNITATFDYAPYGSQALGTAPNGPGYTGHVNDPDTGLVYMQARYYDPQVGRFISTDPIGPAAGNPFNFNRFAYANNSPAVNIDLDGRCTGSLNQDSLGNCSDSGKSTTDSGPTSGGVQIQPKPPASRNSGGAPSGGTGSAGSRRGASGGCCGGAEGGEDEDQGKEQAKNAFLAMISEAQRLSEAGYLGKFTSEDIGAVLDALDEMGSKGDLALTIGALTSGNVKSELANADSDIRAYKTLLYANGPGPTGITYYGFVQWGYHYDWSKFDPGQDNPPAQILHNLFWSVSQLPGYH